ncbi:MAG: hypothetical protein LBW85_05240 [Deltaproteobacteria bacterium]|jgi:hypothetical protein|nr:hypothetical protein [Deltaproteobacteria bacterium]
MKTALTLPVCLALALTLASCGDARLNTSDASSFMTSIQKMYDSVQGDEREEFLKYFFIAMNGRSDLITLSVLNGEEIGRLDGFYNVLASRKRPEELQALNGLTVSEVVELGRGLKITYLEGRLQEIGRDIGLLKDSSDSYLRYIEQLDMVEVTPGTAAAPVEGEPGKLVKVTVAVAVNNGSELPVLDLQRAGAGAPPWNLEISQGDSRLNVPLSSGSFTDEAGNQVFPSPGVPAGENKTLRVLADVSSMGWPYPPEVLLKASFSDGIGACLEGWEQVFEEEDAHRRVMELERQQALLNRELSETRS